MDQQRPAAAVMCFQHAKTRFLWSFLINVSCFYHSPQLISSRAENRNRRMFGAVVVSGASGRKTLCFYLCLYERTDAALLPPAGHHHVLAHQRNQLSVKQQNRHFNGKEIRRYHLMSADKFLIYRRANLSSPA